MKKKNGHHHTSLLNECKHYVNEKDCVRNTVGFYIFYIYIASSSHIVLDELFFSNFSSLSKKSGQEKNL